MTDAPRIDGPVPATGTLGVGRGDGVAVGANAVVVGVGEANTLCVGVGVLATPVVGVGVFVGPAVGVGVAVDVGVDVGVPVAAAIENVKVHAGAAASGVAWGTVGATGSSC